MLRDYADDFGGVGGDSPAEMQEVCVGSSR